MALMKTLKIGNKTYVVEGGLSNEAKQALLDCFANVAWTTDEGQDYYDALEAALFPPATLLYITAVYTQSGTVYDDASLDNLKSNLVVTAWYDDNTNETVESADYTLSGTLAEGTSTITVTYENKTTTFTVTVTHMPETYTITNNLTGATNSNDATSATEGDSYSATIAAASGYTLTGATISVTMGGTDITATAYNAGNISIASLTGDLVITVTAVAVELVSISAAYTNASANVALSSDMKKGGYIADAGQWTVAGTSVSLAIPVTIGKAYKLDWSTTDESTVGNIFRWAFCDSDTPSGQTLEAWNRYSPQDVSSVTVKAVDDYLIVQLQAAYADTIISNGYLTVTEYTNSIFDIGTLDGLKTNLTVTATYSEGSEILSDSDYTLSSGSLSPGENTITVSYGGKTDTFTAIVTAPLYSIPDFAETTATGFKLSKTDGLYTLKVTGNSVVYLKPDGTISTSKSNTLWFTTPDSKPLRNLVDDVVWDNPNTVDGNFQVKFAQSDNTGNVATAEVVLTKNTSGTGGSGQYVNDAYPLRNYSCIALQVQKASGTGNWASEITVSFKHKLYSDGMRYL